MELIKQKKSTLKSAGYETWKFNLYKDLFYIKKKKATGLIS
jgi:hypothetical protein